MSRVFLRLLICGAALLGPAFSPLKAANFSESNRWTSTATDGLLPGVGSPLTLTWSIVADGLALPTVYTDPRANPSPASNLVATLDTLYAVPADSRGPNLTQRVWFAHLQTVFSRYASKTGISYVYVADDGAAWGSAGQLGARGDIRVAGTALTGPLGYNAFPPDGDMVLNTGFTGFSASGNLMVVFGHEHAHGLGLGHVLVAGSNSLSVVAGGGGTSAGPQVDDLSFILRAYGDFWEKGAGDGARATARALGALPSATALSVGAHATDLPVLAGDTDFAHSSGSGDVDYLRFTAPFAQRVAARLSPQGPTYSYVPEGGAETTINLSAQADLGLELQSPAGATLAASDQTGTGLNEIVTFDLPAAGDYLLRVGNKTAKGQFYRLEVGALAAFGGTLGARLRNEFNTAGDTEGWGGATNLSGFSVAGGVLTGAATSADPFFTRGGLALPGGSATVPGARHVLLRFRSSASSAGQLKWTTAARPGFAEERNADFAFVGDNVWQTIAIDLSAHPLWAGQTITSLRIDPSTTAGAVFEIDHIRVSDGDLDGDGLPDLAEGFADTDGDGLGDHEDLDSDGDGAPDALERTRGSDARAARFAFEFENPNDFEGWNAQLNQLPSPSVAGGLLGGASSGADAYAVVRNLQFPAAAAPFLVLRARAVGAANLQLFWATSAANSFAATRRLDIPLAGDGVFRTLVVDLRALAAWSGTITQLRLDWPGASGVLCEVDYLRSTAVEGDYDADGLPDAWEIASSLDLTLAADAAADADGDGMTNLAEYLAGTGPRDPADHLRATLAAASPARIEFTAKPDRLYAVQRSTTLAPGSWTEIGRVGPFASTQTAAFTDQTPPSGDRVFYRLVLIAP